MRIYNLGTANVNDLPSQLSYQATGNFWLDSKKQLARLVRRGPKETTLCSSLFQFQLPYSDKSLTLVSR